MVSNVRTTLKKIVKGTLHSFGLDIIRYNVHTSRDILIKTILNTFQISTVLDVGANAGQYGSSLIDIGYKGTIYSFEPIPSVYDQLKTKARYFKQWKTINEGIGDSEGEMMMNISENLVSSSLLKIGSISLEAAPSTRIARQERIRMTTIDRFMSDHQFVKPILLKLDVQGYELNALQGAITSLKAIDVVQVELSFARVYENGPGYQDVIDFLTSNGFNIYSIIPEFINPTTGQMLQADGIFVRKNLKEG